MTLETTTGDQAVTVQNDDGETLAIAVMSETSAFQVENEGQVVYIAVGELRDTDTSKEMNKEIVNFGGIMTVVGMAGLIASIMLSFASFSLALPFFIVSVIVTFIGAGMVESQYIAPR